MLRVGLFLLVFFLIPAAAFSQSEDGLGLNCPFEPPTWVTEAEKWAFNENCKGLNPNMMDAPGGRPDAGCNALDLDQPWPESRRISARFINYMVLNPGVRSETYYPGFSVKCATIDGDLEFWYSDIESPLWLSSVRLNGGIISRYINLSSDIRIVNSYIDGEVYFDTVRSNSGILFWGTHIQKSLRLYFFHGAARLNFAGVKAKEIEVSNASVTFLELTGAHFDSLYVNNSEVHRNMLLQRVIGQSVRVTDTNVGRNLTLNHAVLDAGINVLRSNFGAGLYCYECYVTEYFNFKNSAFGEDFVINRSLISNLNLFGSEVAGQLSFSSGKDSVSWISSAELDLRDVKVGIIQADFPKAFWRPASDEYVRADGGGWSTSSSIIKEYMPLNLTGLVYDRIYDPGTESELQSAASPSVKELVRWINGSSVEKYYNPQPFKQLISYLEATDTIEDVKYATLMMRIHRFKNRDWTTPGGLLAGVGDTLWGGLTLFGVYPFLAIFWFGVIVVVGAVLISKCGSEKLKSPFWFSLENALPLIPASPEHASVVFEHSLLRNFFHFQKVAGFVLATVLVGALTLAV